MDQGQTTLDLVDTKPGKNKEILLHDEAVRYGRPARPGVSSERR